MIVVNENLKICLKTDTHLNAYAITSTHTHFWYGCIIYTICEYVTRLEMEERWRNQQEKVLLSHLYAIVLLPTSFF